MAKTKIKLPKTIAGMKVPKPLRKSAVTSFLNDPLGMRIYGGGRFIQDQDARVCQQSPGE